MKLLFANKFLYPKGGCEVYMLKLGEYLMSIGHEVRYFGMEDPRNTVTPSPEYMVANVDFHSGGAKISQALKTIYSSEAKQKMTAVLNSYHPDLVHMNNYNYQLTPSIVYAAKKAGVPLVQTVHDVQMICPNHRMYIEQSGTICEKCVHGAYYHCVKQRCLHGSMAKSLVAAAESYYYHGRKTYHLIDRIISPSHFLAGKLIAGGLDASKIVVMHNFIDKIEELPPKTAAKPYALYFGRISKEKGIETLMEVCKQMPQVHFVIAGGGPLEDKIETLANVEFVGYQTKKTLHPLIRNAAFSLVTSEWYENCPLSIVESQALGTPVITSDYGGSVELVEDGETGLVYKGGDAAALRDAIQRLWGDQALLLKMERRCLAKKSNTVDIYANRLIELYDFVIKGGKNS